MALPEESTDTPIVIPDREAGRSLTFRGVPVLLPDRRDVRLRLAAVTTSLHVLGQLFFEFNLSIAQILVSLAAAAAVEMIVIFKRQHVIAWPASALLTGNSVALILRVPGTLPGEWWSMRGWYIFAATSALAIASKYVIRYKGNHIFNPSNFLLVVVFVVLGEQRVDPQILWWGPWSPGLVLGFVVIVGGSIAVTHQVKQLRTAVSFWVPFALLMAVVAASGHAITTNWYVGPLSGWHYWVTLVASPEVMVFLFYMITDPKASPRTSTGKIIFGFLIAITSALLVAPQTTEYGTKVAILAGLVLMCPLVPFIDNRVRSSESRHRLRWQTTAYGAVALVLFASAGGATSLISGDNTFPHPATESRGDMAKRDRCSTTDDDLPPVTLGEAAARSAFDLDVDLATVIAYDVLCDLAIEQDAIRTRDPDLANVGLAGPRLEQTKELIAGLHPDGAVGPNVTLRYESLEVTLFKPDDGPQTSPQLAVRVSGTIVSDSGDLPFDNWFTVMRVDGVHLVSGEYDSERKPVHPHTESSATGTSSGARSTTAPGASEQNAPELMGLQMVDRTEELGLAFPHSRTGLGEGSLFRLGGAAVGDIDGDGWPDIFLPRVGYPDLLFRNDNGNFVEISREAGLHDKEPLDAVSGGTAAAAFIDLDSDGNLDLVTLGVPDTPNRVWMGDGDGGFEDRTEQWGMPQLEGVPSDGSDSTVTAPLAVDIAVGDIDGDGRLDLLLVASESNRIDQVLSDAGLTPDDMCSDAGRHAIAGLEEEPSATILLRNTGSGFEDVTDRLGVAPSTLSLSSARFVDVVGDGLVDLVLVGEGCTTRLLANIDGHFVDVTRGSGLDRVRDAYGVTTLDIDANGTMDLLFSGEGPAAGSPVCVDDDPPDDCHANKLFINNGDGKFTQAAAHGIGHSGWSWGVTAVDLNNDGLDEFYLTNGVDSVETWIASISGDPRSVELISSNDQLWVGSTSDGVLEPLASEVFTRADGTRIEANDGDGRAVIAADFNHDGLLDLLIINSAGHPVLFINETVNDNHWLQVTLSDPTSTNRSGIGSRVTVQLGDGTSRHDWVETTRSYQAGGPALIHFGLGSNDRITSLTIDWPDGSTQEIPTVSVDRRMRVTRE